MAEEKSDKGFTVVDNRVSADEDPTKPSNDPEPEKDGERAEQENSAPEESKNEASVDDGPGEEVSGEDASEKNSSEEDARPGPHIPVSFPTFILSLHTAAIIHLGLIPDPISGEPSVNIEAARKVGLSAFLVDGFEELEIQLQSLGLVDQ